MLGKDKIKTSNVCKNVNMLNLSSFVHLHIRHFSKCVLQWHRALWARALLNFPGPPKFSGLPPNFLRAPR